ncbi:hypothetical protein ACSNOB_03620 [Micromonospora sp. URMC 106]|uniref:hypothetical protein n=1 Tax=Micromonospora sp. URMC 106 TaxID=3423408 RepID=UPI003F1AE13E
MVDQRALGDHVCWACDDEAGALDGVGRSVAPGTRRARPALGASARAVGPLTRGGQVPSARRLLAPACDTASPAGRPG